MVRATALGRLESYVQTSISHISLSSKSVSFFFASFTITKSLIGVSFFFSDSSSSDNKPKLSSPSYHGPKSSDSSFGSLSSSIRGWA
jgi:hypothetical protein